MATNKKGGTMTDKMTKTSFFLPKPMIRKIKNLSKIRHESMASTIRYIVEKGLDINRFDEIIKHTKSEDKLTKFRLFKLMIRIESIAKKLMDKSANEMDIKEYNKFVEMHEKGFCKEFDIKR